MRRLGMGLRISLIAAGCVLAALMASPAQAADPSELLRLLDRAKARYATVEDYTAIFHKRERIDGTLRPEEVILLKFRRPFQVYLKWLTGPKAGREAIYVEGAHGNKLFVHEPKGVRRLFTVVLDPRGPRALKESRHPITDIGIGRLIQLIVENARRGWGRGELRLIDHGTALEGGRLVWRIEGILPKDPEAGYFCYKLIVSIDQETLLPIHAVVYDWDDRLVEEYTYSDLRLNPGLTAQDFDPSNPAYGFPRWRLTLSSGT